MKQACILWEPLVLLIPKCNLILISYHLYLCVYKLAYTVYPSLDPVCFFEVYIIGALCLFSLTDHGSYIYVIVCWLA